MEAARRRRVLAGGVDPADLQPLYDPWTRRLKLVDRFPWLPGDLAAVPVSARATVHLAPDLAVFRTLFRCFAGREADLVLPRGAFFTGSAVVAAATVPRGLRSPELLAVLRACGHAEEGPKNTAAIVLMRTLDKKRVLVRSVLAYVGGITDILEVRARVEDAMPEPLFPPMEEDDVLRWTNNGYGPYARSDIDIMVRCTTQTAGDAIVREVYDLLKHMDDKPCTIIRTASTVTFARSWPERHGQVVLYVMPSVSSLLLFADRPRLHGAGNHQRNSRDHVTFEKSPRT